MNCFSIDVGVTGSLSNEPVAMASVVGVWSFHLISPKFFVCGDACRTLCNIGEELRRIRAGGGGAWGAEGSVDSPGMLLLRSYGCLLLVLIWLVRNSLGGGASPVDADVVVADWCSGGSRKPDTFCGVV